MTIIHDADNKEVDRLQAGRLRLVANMPKIASNSVLGTLGSRWNHWFGWASVPSV